MIEPSLNQLEQEVRTARAKLATDLSTLRSPATAAEFTETLKLEAMDAKDALLDKAKSSVQSSLESLIEDVKARAAANPAAALAIGAGIAWRLIRHPPIATALIGAGVLSLFRTSPAQTNGHTSADYLAHAKTRLMEQAGDAADLAKEQAAALTETVAAKAAETAGKIKDRAQGLAAQASTAAGNLAVDARQQTASVLSQTTERAQGLAAQASTAAGNLALDARQQTAAMVSETTDRVHQHARSARSAASSAVSRAGAALDDGWQRTQSALGETETRDKLFLAAAGIAVVTALGLAWQRRMTSQGEL
jgi:uncharacterized protein YjbJ (UPF0337 family)